MDIYFWKDLPTRDFKLSSTLFVLLQRAPAPGAALPELTYGKNASIPAASAALRLCESTEKGRYMTATRDIKLGHVRTCHKASQPSSFIIYFPSGQTPQITLFAVALTPTNNF